VRVTGLRLAGRACLKSVLKLNLTVAKTTCMPDRHLPPVLYVEDEENDVMLVRIGFKRAGIEHPLHVLTDGKQAIDYFLGPNRVDGSAPCLLLLDLNLPQLSGFEVLDRLRREEQFKELPIVILSSSEQSADKERAARLGASEYMVKPASMAQIVEIAGEIKRRWLAHCVSSVPDFPGRLASR
jgi:CheY-like chemotaxis protein